MNVDVARMVDSSWMVFKLRDGLCYGYGECFIEVWRSLVLAVVLALWLSGGREIGFGDGGGPGR